MMRWRACAQGSWARNFLDCGRNRDDGSWKRGTRASSLTRFWHGGWNGLNSSPDVSERKTRTITIVGGGLAGLTLGVILRRQRVPVVIWEAGMYPRHRVCGEFVSGRGLETLRRLGLTEALQRSGARVAHKTVFYCSGYRCLARQLPTPAVCLSRFTLDALLAETFRQLGGDLRCGMRWSGPFCQEGVVCASGRAVRTKEGGLHWYGLKAHAKQLPLDADLEMHFAPNGYVGLCQLAEGCVNVCGLFCRGAHDPPLPRDFIARFSSDSWPALVERLAAAKWDAGSFCAVGGLPFRGAIHQTAGECRVGDAFAMIPPVTGNGMSMAFESAEAASGPLGAFAAGEVSWDEACHSVETRCSALFVRRLFWAGWLHAGLFRASVSSSILPWLGGAGFLWRLFFALTR